MHGDTPRTEVWGPWIVPLGSFIKKQVNFWLLSCLLFKYAIGSNLCVCVATMHSNTTALKPSIGALVPEKTAHSRYELLNSPDHAPLNKTGGEHPSLFG